MGFEFRNLRGADKTKTKLYIFNKLSHFFIFYTNWFHFIQVYFFLFSFVPFYSAILYFIPYHSILIQFRSVTIQPLPRTCSWWPQLQKSNKYGWRDYWKRSKNQGSKPPWWLRRQWSWWVPAKIMRDEPPRPPLGQLHKEALEDPRPLWPRVKNRQLCRYRNHHRPPANRFFEKKEKNLSN